MSVLITGITGFVGSHLVEALLGRGDEVTCLARSSARAVPLETHGCRTVVGDLAGAAACQRLVEGADVVFHVAGLVAARRPGEFIVVNRDGTARLAEAARRAGYSARNAGKLGPRLRHKPHIARVIDEHLDAEDRRRAAEREAREAEEHRRWEASLDAFRRRLRR